MPKHFRLGFIGAGGMTKAHTDAMSGFTDVSFAAFCDVKKDKAKAMAERFGAEAFTDPAKMLAAMQLDAVWITLPPFAHGDAEAAAIAAQVPFFIEKPINKDVKQAAKIAAAVEQAGLITCAGYMNRYRRSVEAAQKLLAADPVAYACGGWLGGPPTSGDPQGIWGWWIQKDKSGGQFVEQVTHTIDLARYLMGDAEAVSAFAARGFVKGIKHYTMDDALAVSVKFKSGAVANFCASVACAARGGVFLNVYAGNAAVEFTGWGHDAQLYEAGKQKPRAVSGAPADGSHIFAVEDRVFLRAVASGNPAGIRTSYADAVKTLELTVAATESAEKGGKPVTLKY
jgi:predicted dehydrogenase